MWCNKYFENKPMKNGNKNWFQKKCSQMIARWKGGWNWFFIIIINNNNNQDGAGRLQFRRRRRIFVIFFNIFLFQTLNSGSTLISPFRVTLVHYFKSSTIFATLLSLDVLLSCFQIWEWTDEVELHCLICSIKWKYFVFQLWPAH